MDEIEVDVIEPESFETGLERRLEAFGAMIVVPKLRGDKYVFPLDRPCREHLPHRLTDLAFITVAFGGVELAESRIQCRLGRRPGRHGVGNQCAKAECGDRTGAVA